MRAVLDKDDLFYVLQEEDLLEIQEHNTIHHPNTPTLIFEKAKDVVRHAFVIENTL